MNLTLADACRAMKAQCSPAMQGDAVVRRAQHDSRQVEAGDLFFCIPGERVDGHEYASEALARGAVAVVTERDVAGLDAARVMRVENSVVALGQLGVRWRDRTGAAVVGVTGSAGKTTVKEILAAVLQQAGPTARNRLNLNTQIGLPESLLAATGRERFWVMEAGISKPHDMDDLGAVLRPDLAVIVNVGPGHVEFLGDVRGVARCKSRLLAYLTPGGRGLVSADYPELVEEASAVRPDLVLFSVRGADAPYRGRYLGPVGEDSGRFRLALDGEEVDAVLPWRGAFMAESLIAAAAAGHLLGLGSAQIVEGLRQAVPAEHRFIRTRAGGWTVIDDAYNANPLSMAAALEAAAEAAAGGPLVLVLGEMRELGGGAVMVHEELGRRAAAAGCRSLYWIGGQEEAVRRGLEEAGFRDGFRPVRTPAEFMGIWRAAEAGAAAGVILFKGSRSNRLEQYVAAFTEELAG